MKLIGRIEHLWTLRSSENLSLMSHMYKLCSDFGKMLNKKYSAADLRMLKAAEYIDEHFKENGCLDNAAALSGLSRRHFNDLFKAFYGITPNRRVINNKIEFSKRLLKTDSFSVSETANMCGFSDVYYFSKFFKKETGISPSKYNNSI